MNKYIANMYLGKEKLMDKEGNDVDELYNWLLSRAQGQFGSVHGEIIDLSNQQIVKKFRKSPPD